MKKKLLGVAAVMALIAFSNVESKAQVVNTTTVNLTLGDVIGAITPGGDGTGTSVEDLKKDPKAKSTTTVDFALNSTADYTRDYLTPIEKKGTIGVVSSKAYSISVVAAASNFTGPQGATATIPVSTINIDYKKSSDAAYPGALKPLSTTAQVLFANEAATSTALYDVKYTILAKDAAALIGKTSGLYTVNVYYTIAAK